jgi:L-threonylcarbamoyladenylate synthase
LPLTIIYPGARNLASNLIAKDKSVGLRVTNEDFSKKLCAQFRRPVVSAPASGQSATYTFAQIAGDIKLAVDYVVNFRQDERSQPQLTSIIKLGKGNVFQLIRE